MVETAAILNQADDRALVILDEIGRGTATYDGLSIAWATLEHLHDVNRCRALFATHYHEMTRAGRQAGRRRQRHRRGQGMGRRRDLPARGPRRAPPTESMACRSRGWRACPHAVVDARREVLDALEKGEREGGAAPAALIDDLPLFRAAPAPAPRPRGPRSRPDCARSPRRADPAEALALVYELTGMAGSGRGLRDVFPADGSYAYAPQQCGQDRRPAARPSKRAKVSRTRSCHWPLASHRSWEIDFAERTTPGAFCVRRHPVTDQRITSNLSFGKFADLLDHRGSNGHAAACQDRNR